MIRHVVAFLLATAALSGQTYSALQLADGPGVNCATVSFATSGISGSVSWIQAAGPTTSVGYVLPTQTVNADRTYYSFLCAGTPGAKYYIKQTINSVALVCAATCTDCDSGDDSQFSDTNTAGVNGGVGSGLNCDNIGEPPNVVLNSRPGDISPAAPTHAVTDPYAEAAACTHNAATCSNWESVVSSVKSVGTTQCVDIDPSTGPCTLTSLKNLTGATNQVIIQPDIADELFTTPFTRVDPDDPNVLKMVMSNPLLLTGVNDDNSAFIKGVSNITFRHIWPTAGSTPYAPTQVGVSAIAIDYDGGTPSNGKVTLTLSSACPSGLAIYHEVWLNMPNMTTYKPHMQVKSCSGSTLVLCHSAGCNTVAAPFSGSDVTDATVTWGEGIPVSGATTGASTQITVTAHGLPEGTYTGANYVYVHLDGALGEEINGTHDFTVIDANTIEIAVASTQAYTASSDDFVYYNSAPRVAVINAKTSTNFRCLQCVLGDPSNGQFGRNAIITAIDSTGLIVRDSVMFAGNQSSPVDPVSGDSSTGANYHVAYYCQALSFGGATDLQFINNAVFDCAGIVLDAQNSRPGPEDITIKNNDIIATDRVLPDTVDGYFPTSFNRWAKMRHFIELKGGGSNIAILNNNLSGAAVEAEQAQGYTIWLNQLQTTTDLSWSPFRDIKISGNLITRAPTGFAFGNVALQQSGDKATYSSRVEFTHNIVLQDYEKYRMAPSGLAIAAKTNSTSAGGLMQFDSGGELFNNSYNTYWSNRSRSPEILWWFRHWVPGLLAERNIYVFHRSTRGSGLEGISQHGTVPTPHVTTNYATRFASITADDSNASMQDNLFIPGVEESQDVAEDKDLTADADTVTQTECEAAFPDSGVFAGRVCAPGASYSDRHAAVFPDDSLYPAPTYAAYGAGTEDEVLDRLGRTRDVSIYRTSATLTIYWRSPTTVGCTVRLTDDDWVTATALTDSSSSHSQSVAFTGLSSATAYTLKIECEDSAPVRREVSTL